jgi:hypothetical protein
MHFQRITVIACVLQILNPSFLFARATMSLLRLAKILKVAQLSKNDVTSRLPR